MQITFLFFKQPGLYLDKYFLNFQPQTPTKLAEDIQEIINKDQDESDSNYDMDASFTNSVSVNLKVYLIVVE